MKKKLTLGLGLLSTGLIQIQAHAAATGFDISTAATQIKEDIIDFAPDAFTLLGVIAAFYLAVKVVRRVVGR